MSLYPIVTGSNAIKGLELSLQQIVIEYGVTVNDVHVIQSYLLDKCTYVQIHICCVLVCDDTGRFRQEMSC